jgi:hypothetical protein
VIGNAVHVMRIATRDVEEIPDGKDPAAKALDKKGWAAAMTPGRGAGIAKKRLL